MHAIIVAESSQVADARRRAVHMAQTLGFDETAAGRVAIVATELATNLLKHGGSGEILASEYEHDGMAGVELLALDRGPGIANLQACLQDGYSSAGTTGHGLGAIQRQSQFMQVASWPGQGTAVLARILAAPRSATPRGSSWNGCVVIAMPGQEVCGDACAALETTAGRTVIVADGLGHGPEAAFAALEAVRLFHRHRDRDVPELLEYLHAGLRHTRGAALSVVRFDNNTSRLIYGGIGNVAGAVIAGNDIRRMVSLNGTAGLNARKIQAFEYPYPKDGLVIMYSDGLASQWTLDRYPGLQQLDPTLVAAILYRDFARRRDDVTVVVARGAQAS